MSIIIMVIRSQNPARYLRPIEKVPEISSESFFMPSSVAMVTAAVRAEFHSNPASSILSSEMAICVMLPKSSPLKIRPVNFMKKSSLSSTSYSKPKRLSYSNILAFCLQILIVKLEPQVRQVEY